MLVCISIFFHLRVRKIRNGLEGDFKYTLKPKGIFDKVVLEMKRNGWLVQHLATLIERYMINKRK